MIMGHHQDSHKVNNKNNKMNKSLGITDIYRYYRQENPDGVLRKEFTEIILGFNKFMANKVIEGGCVQLPERLGSLECTGVKIKPSLDENGNIQGLCPNWKKTTEFWNSNPEAKERKEIIFNFNEATQGIRYSVRWSKNKVFVKNKEYYSFRFAFANRRRLNKAIKDGTEYFVRTKKLMV